MFQLTIDKCIDLNYWFIVTDRYCIKQRPHHSDAFPSKRIRLEADVPVNLRGNNSTHI